MTQERWSLQEVFAPVPVEAWMERVSQDLKGRPVEKLARAVEGGLKIRALYTAQDVGASGEAWPGEGDRRRGAVGVETAAVGWEVRQAVVHPEPAEVARRIAEDLGRGVQSIELVVDGGDGVGVRLGSREALGEALGGVALGLVPLGLVAGEAAAVVAGWVMDLAEARGEALAGVALDAGIDPVGDAARAGSEREGAWDAAASMVARFEAAGCGRALGVDTGVWHDAGIDDVRAVAVALATGVTALRELGTRGLAPEVVARQVTFGVSVGTSFFFEVARLRALRVVWSRVLEACRVADGEVSMRVVVRPGRRVLTRVDANVNMLRNVACVFAGAVAGADVITAAPFDALFGPPSTLARRVARNTQLILARESLLDKVMDPAGWAWFIEALTDDIASRAWAMFQAIEAEGGVMEGLRSGRLQAQVDADEGARQEEIRRRRRPITGVSEFPWIGEVAPAVRKEAGAARADGAFAALRPRPLAAGFEALRARSDGWLAARGVRPAVLLVLLGTLAQSIGRSTWSRNLVEAGGFVAVEHVGATDAEALATALQAAGTDAAVVCSADEVYAEVAVPTVAALVAAGARSVLLAGRPGALEAPLRDAGLTDAIFVGCDVLATLESLWSRLPQP